MSQPPPPEWTPPPQWTPPAQWAAPAPGQPTPPSTPPGEGWEVLGSGAGEPYPAQRKRLGGPRGRILAAAVAVIAVVGGGVATYVAVSDSTQQGAASPDAAVQRIVDDINKSDLLGVLNDLAPNERDAVAKPLLADVAQLKRVHVVAPNADLSHLTAVQSAITNLAFAATVPVNDHVQIVQLTGGTVRLHADASKLPFTDEFVKALFPGGLPAQATSGVTTTDIAAAVRGRGGKPIRVAAQKVGGRWYPSLFYTVADNAAADGGLGTPGPADYVAAKGASSPVDAVKQLVQALLGGDVRGAIELLSPDELGAVHDYAGLILKQAGSYPAAPVHVDNLQLSATPGPDGTQSVSLTSVSLTTKDGQQVSIALDGNCVEVTLPGQDKQRQCASQLSVELDQLAANLDHAPLTAEQKTAVTDLFSGVTGGGILTSQSGGLWYVNPVRTVFATSTRLLAGLQGNDLLVLVDLVKGFGH